MNKSANDIKVNLSAQMSSIDSKARTTLADIQSRSDEKLGPLVHKVNYAARRLWERYIDFSHNSPAVSAFLTIQFLLAAVPLAIFFSFMLGTFLTVAFFSSLILGTVLFFAGFALGSVLFITGFIGLGIFSFVTTAYLTLKWFRAIQRLGVREGTREFLFGVQRRVKQEADQGKVYAMRGEDLVAGHLDGKSKVEDVIPGIGSAA